MWKALWNKLFGKKCYDLTINYPNRDVVMFRCKTISKLTQTHIKGVDIYGNNFEIKTTEAFDYMVKGGYNLPPLVEDIIERFDDEKEDETDA